MDREILDFRGQMCPLPVIGLKKAIEGGIGPCTVLVDTEEAVENLTRLVHHFSRSLAVERKGDEWILTVGASESEDDMNRAQGNEGQTLDVVATGAVDSVVVDTHGLDRGDGLVLGHRLIVVAKDGLGAEGDLAKQLMKTFFFSLTELDVKPKAIVALNRGVLLLAEDSPVADTVAELQAQGVAFEACGLCLQYFNKKALDNVAVTNMYAIGTKLLMEDVVTLP